jgi:UDP-3-O-[3-hydroxymyristoyl] glucosamine N-acyltransferase
MVSKREAFLLRSGLELPKPFAGIVALSRFGQASAQQLCFCDRAPSAELVRENDVSTIMCPPALEQELAARLPRAHLMTFADARATFIDLAQQLLDTDQLEVTDLIPKPLGVHPSVRVGVHSYIHPEARIDEGVVIGANCTVHKGVWLKKNVHIGDGVVLGNAGINAYKAADGRVLAFPHLAGVVVGEHTHIGANAVVVRGVLTSTLIGAHVVIGNLCNIGHGVQLADHVWMSVGCKIGGHTQMGEHCTVGLGAMVRDNLSIGARSQIGMGAVVVKDVSAEHSVFGNPARTVPPLAAGPQR